MTQDDVLFGYRLRLVEDQPPLRFHPNISFRGPLEMWVRAD